MSRRLALATVSFAFSVSLVLTGCAAPASATAHPRPPVAHRLGAVQSALAYQQSLRNMTANELNRERAAQSGSSLSPLGRIKHAMLLSHPQGNSNLPRALVLLESIKASEKPEAVALHPLAHLLASAVLERLRLEATTERLGQQLERTGQQLMESQKQADQLQDKLDALTEIERTLPLRPTIIAPPPPQPPGDRRNSR